jgi:copper chaperone
LGKRQTFNRRSEAGCADDIKGEDLMESTTLVAPDISCEHCQHAIEGAIGKLEGIRTVKVNIPTKTVHIDYDPQKVSLAKIEEVLDDIGYTVAQ